MSLATPPKRLARVSFALAVIAPLLSCAQSPEDITSSATGEVIADVTARATGGGAPFDGTVDTASDLDDLVATAWGDGGLGLHRGHAPIESVLEAFLGIDHDEMHVFMEEADLNLAGVCQRLGFDPDDLVETLTLSFVPHLEEGVANGVIGEDEVAGWTERVRAEFERRVRWTG